MVACIDPRQEAYPTKTYEQVSSLINSLLEVCPGTVLFKSIERLGIPAKNNAHIIDIANEIIHKIKTNYEKIANFYKNL